ncbi:transposable element Tcb2 transposase [Trichonephila clavipes]|nr:transposable element Tcb2 transposase [Trichonephila clavipes]
MDSWLLGVLDKFDDLHQCKIRCSVIYPTTLSASNPQISSVLFPDTTAIELLAFQEEMSGFLADTQLSISIFCYSLRIVVAKTGWEYPCLTICENWNPGKHNVVSRTLLSRQKCSCKAVESIQETGNVRRRPGAGRSCATTSTDDRYIQLTARRNRTENAAQLQRQLLLATGRRVSSQTVRNRLHEGWLYARRRMVCIPLTPRHRAARRRWAAEHRDWEQNDWSQVLFTDESRFSLECDTRHVLVWRDRGTRNNAAFVRERSQYRRAGWMVWGGISIGGRTDLHIIRNGPLAGRRYADEILRPYVIPYAGAIGDSFVF